MLSEDLASLILTVFPRDLFVTVIYQVIITNVRGIPSGCSLLSRMLLRV